jgi:zinc transport system ATP-binding protein
MAAEDKILLEMQSVTAGYNNHIILEDVSLTIKRRDFLGIIGANGSGKTTLLKVIMGQLKPLRGMVRFYFEAGEKARPGKHIGYLPQQNMFDKQFPITVTDVVLSGLTSKKGMFKSFSREDKETARQILEQMGIMELSGRAIGNLSGGQMQRVFLARALVSSPEILVLDEPDTFVDQSFSRAFYEILQELNDRIAIVLVSHDLGMISSHVKSIACISRTLHYHASNTITQQQLDSYNCPIDLITHGELPHRVLQVHNHVHKNGETVDD